MPILQRVNLPVDQVYFQELKAYKLQYQASLGYKVSWRDFFKFLISRAFSNDMVFSDNDVLSNADVGLPDFEKLYESVEALREEIKVAREERSAYSDAVPSES